MTANYAYCPGCSGNRSPESGVGNAIIVASDSHLKLVQARHYNWAGDNRDQHRLLTILGEIPTELASLLVFKFLPTSSVPLVSSFDEELIKDLDEDRKKGMPGG